MRQIKRLPYGWRRNILAPLNAYIVARRAKLEPAKLHDAVATGLRETDIPVELTRTAGRHPVEPFSFAFDAIAKGLLDGIAGQGIREIQFALHHIDQSLFEEWGRHGEPEDAPRRGTAFFAFVNNHQNAYNILVEFLLEVSPTWRQTVRFCDYPKCTTPFFLQRSVRHQRFCCAAHRQAAFRNK